MIDHSPREMAKSATTTNVCEARACGDDEYEKENAGNHGWLVTVLGSHQKSES